MPVILLLLAAGVGAGLDAVAGSIVALTGFAGAIALRRVQSAAGDVRGEGCCRG